MLRVCERLCGHAPVCWWFVAFLLTLLVECPVLGWLLRSAGTSTARLLALTLFANLATHPAVWFVFPALPYPYWATLTLSELWAWLAEAWFWGLVLPALGWRRAGWASLCSNLGSFGLGWALFRLG